MRVLFLNAGRRRELVEAFRRALGNDRGGRIFATDVTLTAPALYLADDYELEPRYGAPDYLERLLDFCERNRVELVVPTIDPDLERLDRHREAFAARVPSTRLLLSPPFSIRHCRDKRLSRRLFASLGLETPAEVKGEPTTYPVFVKPPDGSASIGAGLVFTLEEWKRRLRENPELMVEEVVTGPEYTVDVLCDFQGKALIAVPRRRIAVRGGEVCQGIVERDPVLESLAMRAAEGFQCQGPVTVQFRKPAPGRYIAMEINARMGGGLPLTIAAGADWPAWIVRLCRGEVPDTAVNIADGLVMSRYDSSVFLLNDKLYDPSAYGWAAAPSGNKRADRPKALIFDLDDTLYPERDFVMNGYRAAAEVVWKDHGVDIQSDLVSRFLKGERGDLFTPVLRARSLPFEESYVLKLVKAYRRNRAPLRPFLDVAVLKDLKSRGMALGLVSDGDLETQTRKFKNLRIGDWFDAVVFSDALGGRAFWKPSTAPYEAVLKTLGVAPEDAVYIGDNPVKDFLGANALGMRTVQVARPGAERGNCRPPSSRHAPDFRVRSLTELAVLVMPPPELG